MARVTVEDCLDNVDNRFELVLVASKRARQLVAGSDAKVAWENDKATVVALREIAEGLVTRDVLNDKSDDLHLPPAFQDTRGIQEEFEDLVPESPRLPLAPLSDDE